MKKNYLLFSLIAIVLSITTLHNVTYAQLYINEFMASNDGALPGPQGDYPDWIEIYNAGNEAVMLGGYYIYDTLDVNEAFQIPNTYPDSVTIAAGGYLVFYANKGEDISVLNLNFKLSGSGEQIGLWDATQTPLDELTYTDQTADVSYGRYPDGTDAWAFMPNYTPGTANQNPEPAEVELYINEFMASNDAAFPGPQGDFPDWIEIYNAGVEPVMLGGYYMSDDLSDPEAMFQIPSTYPDSVTVPAGGFILFYANKGEATSVLNLNFKLSGGGESIGLWSPEQLIIDTLTYGEQIADTSYGRYANGTDNWYSMPDFTPGASNTNPNPPAEVSLYINEFMASNDAAYPGPQGDYPDWIEIYNTGNDDVNLGGYYFSDDLNDPEKMYQIPSTYPDSVTVPAGGFILFYANKEEATSVLNLNFKLSGSGESIGFWNNDQVFVDSLTYGEQTADTSYGRYADGTNNWYLMPTYTPGATNIYVTDIIDYMDTHDLSINYPNPFDQSTTIVFELNKTEHVKLNIYSITGTLVEVLNDQVLQKGKHELNWDASGLPAGYYLYSIQTADQIVNKKMSKVR